MAILRETKKQSLQILWRLEDLKLGKIHPNETQRKDKFEGRCVGHRRDQLLTDNAIIRGLDVSALVPLRTRRDKINSR